MNKKIEKLVDYLLQNSEDKIKLKALEKLFNSGIPFNLPHKFKFNQLTDTHTILELPHIRKNKNHLGGMHACAIATLGEYPAGLSLIKYFGISKYRLIMRHLEVEYFKQSKEALTGDVETDLAKYSQMKEELKINDKSEIKIQTSIKNQSNEVIAIVHTTWQLKNWKKVSYK